MKRTLHILSLLTLLVGMVGMTGQPVFAADPVVKITPAATTIDVGQTVTIYVDVTGISNLFAVELHLSFDPAVLEVVDADAGTCRYPGWRMAIS